MSYNPFKSTVTDETLVKFLQEDLNYDLLTVPGIGPAAKNILAQNHVRNSYQLLALFLNFIDSQEDNCVSHCGKFYDFLTEIGLKSNRHSITKSIAEKAAIFLPLLYQEHQFSHMEVVNSSV